MHVSENFARWRGTLCVVKLVDGYLNSAEGLQNGTFSQVHVTRPKFSRVTFLDPDAIISRVVTSETGTIVHCLIELVDTDDGIKVRSRWRGVSESGDML